MSPLYIDVHRHLKDCFSSTDVTYSKKISTMHCDFVIRNADLQILFGVEVDGNQHEAEEKQIINDELKDWFFSSTGVPLLRVAAKDVRNDIANVIIKIQSLAVSKGYFPDYPKSIPDYYFWKSWKQSSEYLIEDEKEEVDLSDNTIPEDFIESIENLLAGFKVDE